MVVSGVLVLLFLSVASTSEDLFVNRFEGSIGNVIDARFALWPSTHNAVRAMRFRKRDVLDSAPVGQSDGGVVKTDKIAQVLPKTPLTDAKDTHPLEVKPIQGPDGKAELSEVKQTNLTNHTTEKKEQPTVNPSQSNTANASTSVVADKTVLGNNVTTSNEVKATPSQLDLNNPGVLKRGLIVFGGFGIMAVAYYIFIRRNKNNNDSNNPHNSTEANQFRYGVLQSEEQRDHMELSRIPLTMDSEDEDDEDLEIFDLEQKKKSLSYVNLQPNDDDFEGTNSYTDIRQDRNDLLLDIDDKPSDTLINWSVNN